MTRVDVQALFIYLLTNYLTDFDMNHNAFDMDLDHSTQNSQHSSQNPLSAKAQEFNLQHEFNSQQITTIYKKQFGSQPPPSVIEAMAYWDIPNDQRAQVAYKLGQLVRLIMDHLMAIDHCPTTVSKKHGIVHEELQSFHKESLKAQPHDP